MSHRDDPAEQGAATSVADRETESNPGSRAAPESPIPSAATRSEVQPRRFRTRAIVARFVGIGAFYVIVFAFFAAKSPDFLSGGNLADILASAAPLGMVAIGQTAVIVGGGFDLSVGGVAPLGAVLFQVFDAHTGNLGLSVVGTAVCGAAFGLASGVIIAYLKINPLIATLGMLSVTGGIAYIITNGLTMTLPANGGFWAENAFFGIQYGVIGMLALAAIVWILMRFSRLGRSIYAVGGNYEAARLAGIRCNLVTVSIYVLSGLCAALAGSVLASQLFAAAPNLGTSTSLDSVTAVVLGGASLAGGVGGVWGTLLGVLLLGTISDGLGVLQISSYYQTIISGAVLLVAVGFARFRSVLLGGRFR